MMINPASPLTKKPSQIEFAKMAGGGNDFVIIDNRSGRIEDTEALTRRICTRRLSVGADGLILVERSAKATFRIRYFNADGSAADFCANGTRCAARFAFMNVIAPRKMTIETGAGVVSAEVVDREVDLHLPAPRDFIPEKILVLPGERPASGSFVVVGVPHYVLFVTADLWGIPIESHAPPIRNHAELAPDGANVDYVLVRDRNHIDVRTWERGVEGETLSCGSGVTASAAVAAMKGLVESPVSVRTRSGISYLVSWETLEESVFEDGTRLGAMTLRGDARLIYRATLTADTIEGFDPEWVRNPGGGPAR